MDLGVCDTDWEPPGDALPAGLNLGLESNSFRFLARRRLCLPLHDLSRPPIIVLNVAQRF